MAQYSSIGRRFAAMALDGLILLIPSIIISMAVPILGPFLLTFLYKPIFESSRAQATPGKRIMGIRVTTVDGQTLSLKRSLVRTLVSSVSGLLFALGHLAAFFTEKKQALHDMLADSVVVPGVTGGAVLDAWADQLKSLFTSNSSPQA